MMQRTEEKRITTEKKKKQVVRDKKGENGITLVALVVTIVVLLILAGITITYVMGDNSIIQKAQEAKNKTEESIKQEQNDLGELVNELNKEYNSEKEEMYKIIWVDGYNGEILKQETMLLKQTMLNDVNSEEFRLFFEEVEPSFPPGHYGYTFSKWECVVRDHEIFFTAQYTIVH